MAQVGKELDGDGHKGETPCANDGEDDIWPGEAASLGHPDEDDEARGHDWNDNLDREEEVLRAVEDGGCDGRGDEADDDEDCAANARLVVGEAVWDEDLVEETGHGVEEADVDGKGAKDEPEFERADGCSDGWEERHLGRF